MPEQFDADLEARMAKMAAAPDPNEVARRLVNDPSVITHDQFLNRLVQEKVILTPNFSNFPRRIFEFHGFHLAEIRSFAANTLKTLANEQILTAIQVEDAENPEHLATASMQEAPRLVAQYHTMIETLMHSDEAGEKSTLFSSMARAAKKELEMRRSVEKAFPNALDRKSTRLNSSHLKLSRMPSSA